MFFTEKYANMNDEDREELLKTLFMQTDSEYCEKVRLKYYAGKLKHMGKNVKIGTGVKFVNPEFISIGDDVVIMDDDLRKISRVIRISKKTMAIVKQNIVFALGVKGLILLLGALGMASMWAAVFADVGVSVLAIMNSMRTLRAK